MMTAGAKLLNVVQKGGVAMDVDVGRKIWLKKISGQRSREQRS